MNNKAVRILLAENQRLFRQCLGGMLGREGFEIVGETDRAAEIPELYRSCRPNVIIMDIILSDGNVIDLLTSFLFKHPHLAVLILSSYYEPELVQKVLSLDVKGYFTKQASLEEIVEAIVKVVKGERAFQSIVLDNLLLSFQKRTKKLRRPLEDDEITILKLCSEGKTYAEIAAEMFIGERTLYRKLNNICEKLGVSNKMQAITTVIKKGLI